MSYKIYINCAYKGNLGEFGAGAVIFNTENNIIKEIIKRLDITTENIAQYICLKITLERATEMGIKNAYVFMDSNLVIEQMKKSCKIENENLHKIYHDINVILTKFDNISFIYISPELNTYARSLANKALEY